jgi:hypothetical protein
MVVEVYDTTRLAVDDDAADDAVEWLEVVGLDVLDDVEVEVEAEVDDGDEMEFERDGPAHGVKLRPASPE